MSSALPRSDIYDYEKNRSWVKQHFEYAISLLSSANPRINRITRALNGYNLRYNPKSVETLTNDSGYQANRQGFIAYPWMRPKIDLIVNEFLLRPLSTTVYTTNSAARTAKLNHYETLVGAVTAKKEIEKLRENGVDPLEGMAIPDTLNDEVLASMSFKDMNEDLMQIIIDECTLELDMKLKLKQYFFNIAVTGEAWSRLYVDENGDEQFANIDPRHRIAEEIDDDIFFERSSIRGHEELMPLHTVFSQFKLTKSQRDSINAQASNILPNTMQGAYRKINGASCVRVIFLEWDGVEAVYTKISPKTARQLAFDNSSDTIRMDMPASWYEKNIPLHEQKSKTFQEKRKNGTPLDGQPFVNKKPNPNIDYDVEVGWKQVLYRDILIGTDILVYAGQGDKQTDGNIAGQPSVTEPVNVTVVPPDSGTDTKPYSVEGSVVEYIRAPFTMRREDDKKNVYAGTYTGCRFDVVNGETVSLFEVGDRFAKVLDNIMYKAGQELAGFKGKTIWFNEDGLRRKATIKQIMYEAVNDRFVVFSASGQNNVTGRNITPQELLQQTDIGFSASFPELIRFKQEMQATLDRLTGINDQRMGQTLASETATNAQSETITEGMFYLMSLATEKIFTKLCETTKLTWGLYKTEKAKIILGDKLFRFMQVTNSIAYQDYGVHLLDGGKALKLTEQWGQDAQAALNAKTIKFKDKVAFDLAPSLIEKSKVLEAAEARVEKMMQDEAAQEQKAQADNVQAQIASNEKIALETREDNQKNQKDNIRLEADEEIRVFNATNGAKAQSQLIIDQNKIEQSNLHQKDDVQTDEGAIAAREDQSAILQHNLKKDEISHQANEDTKKDLKIIKATPKPVVQKKK